MRSVLVGPQEELKAHLERLGAAHLGIEVVHAPDVVEMDESPTRAVRKKPQSSLCVAYNLVESGKASSIISSGNSGAMMAAGRIICGLLPGIERPAIATLIPVLGDELPNVILDAGANVDCHSRNLVQFAVMGSVYFSSLFKIDRPKVALLSNGTEASKGTDVIREAAAVLSQMDSVNYCGYVEGRDFASSAVNVIVCDGFVGNVVLKALEGCVRLVARQLVLEGKKSWLGWLGLMLFQNTFKRIFLEKFDYTAHGGAPLLGLRKLAIVLHGSSDARAVKNGIRVAETFAKSRMTQKIASELALLEERMMDLDEDMFSVVLAKKKILENGSKSGGKSLFGKNKKNSVDEDNGTLKLSNDTEKK